MSDGSVYSFSMEDKFGAMGVVGVVIIHDSKIHTFLLSCRAFGREIEKMMLIEAVNHYNCYPIFADYIESHKNQMTKNFYKENGFLDHEEDRIKKSKTYIIEKNVQYPEHFFKEITWN
jgi:predicted enzyme involved in methoxymalonyl-ACP biosynthesis